MVFHTITILVNYYMIVQSITVPGIPDKIESKDDNLMENVSIIANYEILNLGVIIDYKTFLGPFSPPPIM